MSHDILVLGSGPAGLAAAVAARGRGKSVLVIGNRWQDSPLARAERVDNYLGLPASSGKALLEQFYDHAAKAGVDFVTGRAVSMMVYGGVFATVGSQVYDGKALILAPGVQRQAKYPGEETYLGRGVSYCATCDGMLYRGRNVVVLGWTGRAEREADFLRGIGCAVRYYDRPQGVEILGEEAVTGVRVNGREEAADAVFLLRPAVAPAALLPGLAMENGSVTVDRQMATNLPGVFAAGDCTGAPYQVAKAVGEGLIAGQSAAKWADRQG